MAGRVTSVDGNHAVATFKPWPTLSLHRMVQVIFAPVKEKGMYITDMGYCYPTSEKAKSIGKSDTGTWYCTNDDGEFIPMESPYEAVRYTFYNEHSKQALGSAIYWAHQKLTAQELLVALPLLGNVRIERGID